MLVCAHHTLIVERRTGRPHCCRCADLVVEEVRIILVNSHPNPAALPVLLPRELFERRDVHQGPLRERRLMQCHRCSGRLTWTVPTDECYDCDVALARAHNVPPAA